ncbi:hypothetical protein T4D_4118 [Trichinella pseudospiralis]|uniref:Uncharacterized protein n=1 Tax=Trichinella pseudospiralis TaxID=6337 RepID=A0A0V1F8X3_TRIPS|nr:hypothetical protein T4D_4118 [Trichinella pseudospiralis]
MASVSGDGVIFSMMGNTNFHEWLVKVRSLTISKFPLSSSNNPVHKLISVENLDLQLHHLLPDIFIKQQAEVPLTRYEAIAEP